MTSVDVRSVPILIVDDHPLLRRALRGVIELHAAWRVIGEAASAQDGIRKSLELQPEIVVLDLGLPESNGMDTIRSILQAAPGTRVLVLTMFDAENLIEDAIRAGAAGYIFKSDVEGELVAGIAALLEGKTYFNSPAARLVYRRVIAEQKAGSESQLAERLSVREIEILKLLARGNNNKQVASTLQISVRTVENHRNRIMQKLSVHSFGDLLLLAIREQVISP